MMATTALQKRIHSPAPSHHSNPSTPQREDKKQRIYSPKSAAAHSPGQALYYSDGVMSDLLPGEPTDQELVEDGWGGNWLLFLKSYGLKPNAYGYLKGKKILNKMRVEMRGDISRKKEMKESITNENDKGKKKDKEKEKVESQAENEDENDEECEQSEEHEESEESGETEGINEQVDHGTTKEANNGCNSSPPSSSFESPFTSSFDASPSPLVYIPGSIQEELEYEVEHRHDFSPDYNSVILSSPSTSSQDSEESFDQEPSSPSDNENYCFDEHGLDDDDRVASGYVSDGESEEGGFSGDNDSSPHLGIYDIENPVSDE